MQNEPAVPLLSHAFKALINQNILSVSSPEGEKLVTDFANSIKNVEQHLEELLRHRFGKKSAQLPSINQLHAFEDNDIPAVELPEDEVTISYKRSTRRKKKLVEFDGRFPETLPREDAGVIELTESERHCADCGTERVSFKEEISERLSYKHQVSLVVKQYRRQVCRCPNCTDSLAKAPAPKAPLSGVQVESSFLAHIFNEKFAYGLPFYRVEDRLAAEGLPMTRSLLAEYQNKTGSLLAPLGEELLKSIQAGHYLHCDESHWQVARKVDGKQKYCRAWNWTVVGEENDVLVKYGISRNKSSVETIIGKYDGFIVCDGEDHYDHYLQVNTKARVSRCNAHARNRFEKALTNDRKAALYALKIYQVVYRREAYIKDWQEKAEPERRFPPEVIVRLRRRSKLLLERLYHFCKQYQTEPKSPIGKACSYFEKFYRHLTQFCSDGRLPIDNNTAERVIRQFVIGRKAWLFSSSEEGAKASALLYSLVLTCKLNDISVTSYLTDVIHRIGVLGDTDYKSMLPRQWQVLREQKKAAQQPSNSIK
jgi:transposase